MLNYRDLINTFRQVGMGSHSRVIVHASLSSLGPVSGGAETLLGALTSTCDIILMPTFTYRTMIIPEVGPPQNGMDYGSGEKQNKKAEFFLPGMPADPAMGVLAETLRRHPAAGRSDHPILSFAAVNGVDALVAQTLEEPFAPIRWMAEFDGDVLLLGVDHTVNTSLHHAEKLAGRKQFIRWALTPEGVVECPNWPGCSNGFQSITERLEGVVQRAQLGDGYIEIVPLRDLIHITVGWIREDPRALLCDRVGCERCSAVRSAVRVSS
jgi:aminoglycoside 3-N-acetyltransferase